MMDLKKQYKLWMDELHNRIETDFGYTFADYGDELRTPKKKPDGSYYFEGFDETKTPPETGKATGMDELRVQKGRESAQTALTGTQAGALGNHRAAGKNARKRAYDDEYLEYLIFIGEEPETEEMTSYREDKTATAKRDKAIPEKAREKFDDDFLAFLFFIYNNGVSSAGEMLETEIEPDAKKREESVFKETAEKTYQQRLDEYYITGDIESITRVAETESHRVFNDGLNDGGKAGGARFKRWETMRDDKVRDTHWHLQGVQVPMDEMFFTFDGDCAMCPGGFEDADNNVNCRCYLHYSK